MTAIVPALPGVTEAQRAQILASPRTCEAHTGLMAEIPAMTSLEVGGAAPGSRLPPVFTIAAWNLERCLFPGRSAEHLRVDAPALVLLSEMDIGMARTAQRNTMAKIAAAMDMTYCYGVEFFEMNLGGPTERQFCKDDFNAAGWHGNGILSSVPFERLELVRFDDEGRWFLTGPESAASPDQPRVGGRMAVAAVLPTEAGPICTVSTHLESNADQVYRARQFGQLLDAIDAFAPDMPVLIGGDLNTGNHMPPDFDWRRETLFDLARSRGYCWEPSPEGMTTCPSLLTPHPSRKMRLDWFCVRGVSGQPMPLRAPRDPDGTPLSDHFSIAARIAL